MDPIDVPTAWMEFFLVIAAVVTTVYGLIRWSTRRLEEKIIEVTRPIHPESNGGHSLRDLHDKVDKVHARMEVLEQEQRYLRFIVGGNSVYGNMDGDRMVPEEG